MLTVGLLALQLSSQPLVVQNPNRKPYPKVYIPTASASLYAQSYVPQTQVQQVPQIQQIAPPPIITDTYNQFLRAKAIGDFNGMRANADRVITLLALNPKYRDWLKANQPDKLYMLLNLKSQMPQQVVYTYEPAPVVIPVFPNYYNYGYNYGNYYYGHGYFTRISGYPMRCYPRQCYTNRYSYGVVRSFCSPIRYSSPVRSFGCRVAPVTMRGSFRRR